MKKEKIRHSFPEPDYPVKTQCLTLSYVSEDSKIWHFHREAEILIIQTGTAYLQTENDSLLLPAGQGIFLKQNEPHTICSYDNEGCTIYSLHFQPSFLFGHAGSDLNVKYLTPVVASPDFHYILLDPGQPKVAGVIKLSHRIMVADTEKIFAYELEVKGLLLQLWRLILPHVDGQSPSGKPMATSSYDSIRIDQAIRFMEDHHADSITLEDIANSIHISKSECCRCFRRCLGITPFEYLLKYRIHESVGKLQSGEASGYTISELAASVGFNSPSYYNKVFRKYMNCTPMEYKKSVTSDLPGSK